MAKPIRKIRSLFNRQSNIRQRGHSVTDAEISHAEPSFWTNLLPLTDEFSVSFQPSDFVEFHGPLTATPFPSSVTITNKNAQPIVCLLLPTTLQSYQVQRHCDIVKAGESAEVPIRLQPMEEGPPLYADCKDKLCIASTFFTPSTPEIEEASLEDLSYALNDAVKSSKVHVHTLRVAYLSLKGRSLSEDTGSQALPTDVASNKVTLRRSRRRLSLPAVLKQNQSPPKEEFSISFEPSRFVQFQRPLTRPATCLLTITHNSPRPVFYYIKTNAPNLYRAEPYYGRIEAGKSVKVSVELKPMKNEPPPGAGCKDRFFIRAMLLTTEMRRKPLHELVSLIIQDHSLKVHYQTLRVVYLPVEGQVLPEEVGPQPVSAGVGEHQEAAIYSSEKDPHRSSTLRKRYPVVRGTSPEHDEHTREDSFMPFSSCIQLPACTSADEDSSRHSNRRPFSLPTVLESSRETTRATPEHLQVGIQGPPPEPSHATPKVPSMDRFSISIEPSGFLAFRRPLTRPGKCLLTITNGNARPIAYIIKTNAPKSYRIHPPFGFADAGESVVVSVELEPMEEEPPPDAKCTDSFFIESMLITPEIKSLPLRDLFLALNGANDLTKVYRRKLRVKYSPRGDRPLTPASRTVSMCHHPISAEANENDVHESEATGQSSEQELSQPTTPQTEHSVTQGKFYKDGKYVRGVPIEDLPYLQTPITMSTLGPHMPAPELEQDDQYHLRLEDMESHQELASRSCAEAVLSDSDSSPLTSLLTVLKNIQQSTGHVNSAANQENIHLLHEVFDMKDYDRVVLGLQNAPDIEILFDFFFSLLEDGDLPSVGAEDMNRKMRNLMLKVAATRSIIPRSLYLSGVKIVFGSGRTARGGFGRVHFGKYRGVEVAVKIPFTNRESIAFLREAILWRSLSHQYVLPLLGIFHDKSTSSLCLVSLFMKNGTLRRWRSENHCVKEIQKRILEVAEGVQYLHSEGIVHGDLRGSNVLLDSEYHVQIADFGLTRLADATVTSSGAMSYHFAAPELFGASEDECVDETLLMTKTTRSDVYAFGCLYYEVYFNRLPFEEITNHVQIMTRVVKGERPSKLDQPTLGDQSWELVQDCWRQNKDTRPTMEDIVRRMTQISHGAT